jgi:very-short-patch-repair endonuclease
VKLRLADVIWCPPSQWKTAHGARVSQKHLDFVLYDRETTEVGLAIELDDRSHARRERRARDAFVDEVLDGCGVVLLRVRAAAAYDVAALQARIEALVQRGCRGLARRRREVA